MKICVLQPICPQSNGNDYDRVSNLGHLLPNDTLEYVFLNKATIYQQLKQLKKQHYDVFINLCRGCRDESSPSCYEVTGVLEDLNLPYTGSALVLYDTPKSAMKHIAYYGGVETPFFAIAETLADVESVCETLSFPLFVKPLATTDCLGIDTRSCVKTKSELLSKVSDIIENYETAFIEEYVTGREFSVLVAASAEDPQTAIAYCPIEITFSNGQSFQTQDLRKQLSSSCFAPCNDLDLDSSLREAAKQMFSSINQGGYACFDFRVDDQGEIYFLDVNYPCAIFNSAEGETIADSILRFDGTSQSEFLQHIIAEGIARHQRRQRKYRVQKSAIATYGIFANQALKTGEVIVSGENRLQKVVTRSHAGLQWTPEKQKMFLRYIYPFNKDTFILRDPNHPEEWLLQNHSCNPNTAYKGLDLIALRNIALGDELTVDFATFLDESGLEFECQCGAHNCRGFVRLASCYETANPPQNTELIRT
jgi:D-alanine-D-alanine ligase